MNELELWGVWCSHVASTSLPKSRESFDDVLDRHHDPARHYHSVTHVGWVVRYGLELAERHPAAEADRIVAAAFFHDAIYDATRSDNEALSADLATRTLAELGWGEPAIGHVDSIIRATAGHAPTDDLATAILLAADLSILAADPGDYATYVDRVRQEYTHVDDESWRFGRAGVLRSLLDHESIFDARVAPEHWENRARGNLMTELADLDGSLAAGPE